MASVSPLVAGILWPTPRASRLLLTRHVKNGTVTAPEPSGRGVFDSPRGVSSCPSLLEHGSRSSLESNEYLSRSLILAWNSVFCVQLEPTDDQYLKSLQGLDPVPRHSGIRDDRVPPCQWKGS